MHCGALSEYFLAEKQRLLALDKPHGREKENL